MIYLIWDSYLGENSRVTIKISSIKFLSNYVKYSRTAWKDDKLFDYDIAVLRSHYIAKEASLRNSSYETAANLTQLNQHLTILARSLAVIHQLSILTSPNAPLPMTLRGSKSSTPSLDRFSRRNSVSFWACCSLFSCFCCSERPSSLRDSSSFASLCFRSMCCAIRLL